VTGATGAIRPGDTRTVPASFGAGFPIPSIPVIQDHGVIEIMRGCPQGCRFCQAGVLYRPYRMKSVSRVMEEADWLIHGLGYRELSLSSLSSGDYGPLREMMDLLNARYRKIGVSLQLPSLRVDSFTLPILERLHTVRRAGLTFAVESAGEEQQRWTNKLVPLEKVIAIAREARSRGWRRAKLYFMIGLPGPDGEGEALRILDYVQRLQAEAPLEFVVNIGTFIPKPHTPFQWEPQYTPEEATDVFREVRAGAPRGITVRAHDPWMSWLEGILARGDGAVGSVIKDAYAHGARLDAWTDYLKIEVWKDAVASHPGSDDSLRGFSPEQALPWDGVNLGVSRRFLERERERAHEGILTDRCGPDCSDRCGICSSETVVRDLAGTPATEHAPNDNEASFANTEPEQQGRSCQLLIEYQKRGSAAFLPHLAVVRIFERLGHRISLPMELSSGHHPKPKMSFGQPLPIGVESDMEIGVINVINSIQIENFYQDFFRVAALPVGMKVNRLAIVKHERGEPRVPAPMQLYGGSVFHIWPVDDDASSLEAMHRFLVAAREKGAQTRALNRCIPGRGGEENGVASNTEHPAAWRLVLPRSSPGFGRLLKDNDVRGRVRARRVSIYPQSRNEGPAQEESDVLEKQTLFDWYRGLAETFLERDSLELDPVVPLV
jgi:radical SAM-linked protein